MQRSVTRFYRKSSLRVEAVLILTTSWRVTTLQQHDDDADEVDGCESQEQDGHHQLIVHQLSPPRGSVLFSTLYPLSSNAFITVELER